MIVKGMSGASTGASSGACLGYYLGHVWGIIWGMSGACLGHVWDNIWGILSTMDNNEQQSAVLRASVMPFFCRKATIWLNCFQMHFDTELKAERSAVLHFCHL